MIGAAIEDIVNVMPELSDLLTRGRRSRSVNDSYIEGHSRVANSDKDATGSLHASATCLGVRV